VDYSLIHELLVWRYRIPSISNSPREPIICNDSALYLLWKCSTPLRGINTFINVLSRKRISLSSLDVSQLTTFFIISNVVRSKVARAFYCRLKGETKLEGPNENGQSCAGRQMKPAAVTNHNLPRLVCSSGDCVN
jgi:hypothetical protein